MEELAVEMCEKAQLGRLMNTINNRVFSDSYGGINFVPSKIKKNADFFKSKLFYLADTMEAQYQKDSEILRVKKQSSKEQEVYSLENSVQVSLCSLWYTPHITETVLVFC